jgi:hypothetical protein
MSNLTARVRFSDLTIYSIGSRDLVISGEMDVAIRLCDDAPLSAPVFDLAENVSDVRIDSARVPATGRKVKIQEGGKLVAKLLGCGKVRDRLLDEAQQAGFEWCQSNVADRQNGEVR